MIFESTDAIKSRSQFKTQTMRTALALIGIFILADVVLSGLTAIIFHSGVAVFFANVLVIGGVSGLFLHFNNRPIRLRCNSCKRIILSNTPWVCGFCGKNNEDADNFPFVHRCQHCGAEPKAYRCHHVNCGKLIFLSEDHLEKNYARCMSGAAEAPELDEATVAETQRQKEKREKEHTLEMTALDSQLKKLMAEIEGPKIKSPKEKAIKSFDDAYDGMMAVEEHLAKRKQEVEEKFKDHPSLRKRALKVIDDIARNLMAG